jgi:aspartate aminotransferase-like enzyme
MTALLPDVDPDGLLEYSVVFTDRSLNHMSQAFQQVMQDISVSLKAVYRADAVVVVPGGGTCAMEAVARQFAADRHVLVVRNGWFSYRWTQILEQGRIATSHTVLKAAPQHGERYAPFTPVPLDEARARIEAERPAVVFAPHVETSAGLILPDDYVQGLAEATHAVGGLLVLDCIASGALWVDMRALGVDILISAPQKGWSASPCSGLVMLSERAVDAMQDTDSSSFAVDLKRWHGIMRAYEDGGHAYHATLPTDALRTFRDAVQEAERYGLARLQDEQWELGRRVRTLLSGRGFVSVAAEGFQAPGVVVCYTDDPALQNGSRFVEQGLQIAAGVPLQCDEPDWFRSFRIGLFGFDKLHEPDRSVAALEQALNGIAGAGSSR